MDAWLPEEFCLEPGARKEFIRNLRKTMRMTAH
jgi:hypothetical protein